MSLGCRRRDLEGPRPPSLLNTSHGPAGRRTDSVALSLIFFQPALTSPAAQLQRRAPLSLADRLPPAPPIMPSSVDSRPTTAVSFADSLEDRPGTAESSISTLDPPTNTFQPDLSDHDELDEAESEGAEPESDEEEGDVFAFRRPVTGAVDPGTLSPFSSAPPSTAGGISTFFASPSLPPPTTGDRSTYQFSFDASSLPQASTRSLAEESSSSLAPSSADPSHPSLDPLRPNNPTITPLPAIFAAPSHSEHLRSSSSFSTSDGYLGKPIPLRAFNAGSSYTSDADSKWGESDAPSRRPETRGTWTGGTYDGESTVPDGMTTRGGAGLDHHDRGGLDDKSVTLSASLLSDAHARPCSPAGGTSRPTCTRTTVRTRRSARPSRTWTIRTCLVSLQVSSSLARFAEVVLSPHLPSLDDRALAVVRPGGAQRLSHPEKSEHLRPESCSHVSQPPLHAVPILISALFSLIAYPLGKFLAWVMPIRSFDLPAGMPLVGGRSFSLNPGPFNIKEHAGIGIMILCSNNYLYAAQGVIACNVYYNAQLPTR